MNYIELLDDLMAYVGPGFNLDGVQVKYSRPIELLEHACFEATITPYANTKNPIHELVVLDTMLSNSVFWVKTGSTIWDITQDQKWSPLWTADGKCVRPGKFGWHRVAATFSLRRANGITDGHHGKQDQ